ncbi:MAG: hypothetical protein HY290_16750, partial [Planctomycetia bacterium]|nr:hypothetical protein [Planctomycetia bacterium]
MPLLDSETRNAHSAARQLNAGDLSPRFRPADLSFAADRPVAMSLITSVALPSPPRDVHLAFSALWLMIACVSSVDTYLT